MLRNKQAQESWLRTYTILAGVLILLLLVTAGAGLFGADVYDNFVEPKYVEESRAQDLITLILGIPLLMLTVWGVHQERAWAFPLWTGVLAYELYVYAIYAVGGVYNVFFLGYVAVAALSLYTIVGLLSSVDLGWFQGAVRPSLPRRWIGGFFLMILVMFAFLWITSVLTTISTGVQDSGHLIFVFDLIIVLPAFAITAVKLFRGEAVGDLLAGLLLIKFVALCVSITVGQVFRAMAGLPLASELLVIFVALGMIGLLFTALYFRSLLARP